MSRKNRRGQAAVVFLNMCFPAAGKNLFLLYLRAQAALILKRLCSSARFLRLICLPERGRCGLPFARRESGCAYADVKILPASAEKSSGCRVHARTRCCSFRLFPGCPAAEAAARM